MRSDCSARILFQHYNFGKGADKEKNQSGTDSRNDPNCVSNIQVSPLESCYDDSSTFEAKSNRNQETLPRPLRTDGLRVLG